MMNLETIATNDLTMVTGGQQAAPPPQPPKQKDPGDYSTDGNVVQQSGQMIDNAVEAFKGARKAGASWYEAIGNATIGFLNLEGGFDKNGKPR